jgi:glutaredoxin-like YruB-family protein
MTRMHFFLLSWLVALSAYGQVIYRSVDESGRVRYTSEKPADGEAKVLQTRVNSYTGAPTVSGQPSAPAAAVPEVKMYVTSWCPYCKKARAYLTQRGIRYAELDIEKSREARAEYDRLGARGVPVILVGTQRMNGYSEERLAQLLKAAGY